MKVFKNILFSGDLLSTLIFSGALAMDSDDVDAYNYKLFNPLIII